MELKRYMEDSREPVKRRALRFSYQYGFLLEAGWGKESYPVRNRFPMLALEKLKTLLGLARLTASRFRVFRNERMSSFLGEEMSFQSGDRASTISSHSCLAAVESLGKRWLKKALTALRSGSSPSSGIRRTKRPILIRTYPPSSRCSTYFVYHRSLA